jgi:tetratricopeptide (TPR) repeat protein
VVALFFVLIPVPLPGQSNLNTEVLKKELETASNDTAKVNYLFKIGNLFMDGPSDSLLYYYGEALALIQENLSHFSENQKGNSEIIRKFQNYELRAYIEFGIEYFFRSEYSTALEYYFKALKIAEGLDDREVISECHSEIGIVYKSQGKYDLALVHNGEALEYARHSGDSSWAAVCYANQGAIYLKKGYFTLALSNYLTALKTFEKLEQKRRMGACYLNVGKIYAAQSDFEPALKYYSLALVNSLETGNKINVAESYQSLGHVWLNKKEPRIARNYLDSALIILNESGYSHGMNNCFTDIGYTYKLEHHYLKAAEYFHKALELSIKEDNLPGIAESYINLSEIKYLEQNLSEAIDLASKGLVNAEKSEDLETQMEACYLLAQINEQIGNNKKALVYYKQFSLVKDSLFNESKYKSLRETEVKFETEKKENQLTLLTEKNEIQQLKLERRRNLLFVLVVGTLLILLISYLLIRQNRIKSKQRAIDLEQRLLRSQMNPHFIFNSLIAIQSFIYKSEPLKAGDFLAKFADLMRLTLEHSRVEFVPLSNELKMLTAYLDLQVLRFENKFEYKLSLAGDIDEEIMNIPPMFAQPFLENSIEHGLRYKQEKGHLNIIYSLKSDRCIKIIVVDDGIGREKSRKVGKNKHHRSLSNKIAKERLSILSKKYKYKFNFEVIDLKDKFGHANGTRVTITLPVKLI